MKSKRGLRWIAMAAIFLTGCATTRQYPAAPVQSMEQLVEIGGHPPQSGGASFRLRRRSERFARDVHSFFPEVESMERTLREYSRVGLNPAIVHSST